MKKPQELAILFAAIAVCFNTISASTLGQDRISRRPEYCCRIESRLEIIKSFEGETTEIPLRVSNQGRMNWESQGANPIFLSYHLLDENGKMLKFENPRFSFPEKVRPGTTLEMKIKVKSPLEEGKYMLEFDIVREGAAWFKDYGSKSLKMPIRVGRKEWPEDAYPLSLDYGKYTKFESNIEEFNELLKLIRITLSHNEVTFKGKTGEIFGFSAGAGYPQIWLRDSNTIIPASRYFYNESFLRSWLEEHLAFQKPDGQLEDWVDSRGRFDKNTTETDQETSAVQSAYQITQLAGTEWLHKKIDGIPIIDRLEKSLLYLLAQRFNQKYGLITGAHTADWGDVDMNAQDQRAIYVDEKTHWTSDIYDQSMFFEAGRNLARMLELLERKEKSGFWLKKSALIQENTDKWLWQENRGFYRVHIHQGSLRHEFDEDDMFAMGGNAQAILSGLASEEKAKRIIEQALARQKTYGVSTICGSLLPPYPKNFFKHPALDESYEYQNGGQWDWFGGKLLFTMFEAGLSEIAREKLLEVIRKDVSNGGLCEWDTQKGLGRGSDFYAGSAGSLAKALFEGYFGVKISDGNLSLEPKLMKDRAKVHIYIPVGHHFVAYNYEYSDKNNKLLFSFNSNFSNAGQIKILSPWPLSEGASAKNTEPRIEVLKDGKKMPFKMFKKNKDEFIVVETDFKKHVLEIKRPG